jgi:hypothetical protein
MTVQELWKEIVDKHAILLCSLYERWQDEKQYEDINDYLIQIQKFIPQAYAITKRPFGIYVKADTVVFKVNVIVKGKYLNLSCKVL